LEALETHLAPLGHRPRQIDERTGLRYVNSETIDTWRGVRGRLRFQISWEQWVRGHTDRQ
jgi:hypothetical protein